MKAMRMELVKNSRELPFGFLINGHSELGGMEKRFARLTEYLLTTQHNVILFTSKETYESITATGINIPEQFVTIVESKIISNLLGSRIALKIGLLWRALVSLNRFKLRQLHVCNDPGKLTSFLVWIRWWIAPLSVSVADSRNSYSIRSGRRISHTVAIDCLSEDIAAHVRSIIKDNQKHKVHVSPCSFVPHSSEPPVAMSKREIDVVFAARFTVGKGIDLLRSLEEVPSGARFHILGQRVVGSEYVEPILAGAEIYFSKQLPSVLNKSKIFLSIQDVENYPSQSLLEAMSAGCAIIATDVGETRKIVDPNCGILINKSTSELTEAIHTLLADSTLLERLGRQAAKKVRAEHSVEKFSDYFIREILTH